MEKLQNKIPEIRFSEFKGVEFDSLLYEAGSNSFTLSPTKWTELTDDTFGARPDFYSNKYQQ